MRITKAAAALITLVIALTACGGGGTDSGADGDADAGYPVSITSALGTTTIPSKPERVVTLGWGSTEAAVALGVVPVGMRDMSSDSGTVDGILPWVKDELKGQEPTLLAEKSDSIPYERIAALRPDLILSVQSGLTADQFARLTEIAPTVAQPGKAWQTSWQDQTTIVGQALGKSDEAAELVTEGEKRLADVKAAHPEFAGKTVASVSVTAAGSVGYYFDTDPRVKMLAAMGFDPLPALTQLRESAPEGTFAAQVSWENVPKYSPDVLTAWFLDSGMQSDAEGNPVFRNLRAVQQSSYVPIVDPPLVFAVSSPNVLNLPWMLDRYVPKLSDAAKAVR
ncbi:iron-siderophore ABC transporter substrate-binding protein [Gordonia hydrophobica]|uniref:Iron-siderophore ABC transporter substrate-binding protein n=1 Tax=Gordonia hydrophobica TaxID=40516 RepID=A0ABZ2U2E1_9ACTN|nr:iron-siderophore ABC transporter substrate-binding protein [Gordonia hydrophobica]MBM7368553.1 iron complex transport system substrate-binding protein [Gordonia hydrophobica]